VANLKLTNINKIYPNGAQAVFDFNLEVQDGEFIVLVGPSGCGKSTTLRMIAGLESITSGDMELDGVRINDKSPKDRDIAMVFQDYALYGNLTVYENIGISLTLAKKDKNEIHDVIMDVASIVDLEDYLNRFPKQLSGGQRQRVALGRAIARNAKIFLMDEPLSNLDAKLRSQTRRELVKLHEKLDATIVYVTHDQIEAMTMATRIVIMNNGYIQQVGTPSEVYDNPENVYVGGFIGTPPMNFIKGKIIENRFIADGFHLIIPEAKLALLKDYQNKEVILGVRAENFYIDNHMLTENSQSIVKLKADYVELLGAEVIVKSYMANQEINAKLKAYEDIQQGEVLDLAIDMFKVHFFDVETEQRIR
jgi:multiple sugar transport system ATP-binding protein